MSARRTTAFEWLEKAYEERVNRLACLRVEATWNDIRSDARFQALLKKIGLPQQLRSLSDPNSHLPNPKQRRNFRQVG
jgi:hypothetical protein